jgi:hypothetical protein
MAGLVRNGLQLLDELGRLLGRCRARAQLAKWLGSGLRPEAMDNNI